MNSCRLVSLFLYAFLIFGCAPAHNPHSTENPASDTSLEGEGNRYDTFRSTVKDVLRENLEEARSDIRNIKKELLPFPTKKVDSAEHAVLEGNSTTENINSEASPSDIISSIEGFEVEEVSEIGKSSDFEVEGKEYKRVWDIAEGILKENFKIVESDKEKGTLKGDRRPFSDSWGEIVTIAINPANIESEKYSVEVVTNTKKPSLFSGYNWTTDIIRAIKYSLGMEVAIEVEIEYKRPPRKDEIRPKTEIIIIKSDQSDGITEDSEDDVTDDLLVRDVSAEQLSTEGSDENPEQVSTDEEAQQEIAVGELQPNPIDEPLISDIDDDLKQTE